MTLVFDPDDYFAESTLLLITLGIKCNSTTTTIGKHSFLPQTQIQTSKPDSSVPAYRHSWSHEGPRAKGEQRLGYLQVDHAST